MDLRTSVRRAVLAAILILAVPAAPASADSIALSFGADPTEEVPFTVTATSTPGDGGVYVTVKPAGGLGCAANYAADDPNSQDVIWSGDTGTETTNWTEEEPGSVVFCGYLQRSGSVLAATGPVGVSVRGARASVTLAAPARVDPGQAFPVVVSVTAELQRRVSVTVKRAGGRGCEPSYGADDPVSDDVMYGRAVQGTQTVQETITASETRSTYLLCAYVSEGDQDAPEAAASAQFVVGPDPCSAARAAVTRAARRVRTAEAAATRYRRSWKRYAARARRSSGAAARRSLVLARRHRSRYRSAIRRRARARGALADAREAVTRACRGDR